MSQHQRATLPIDIDAVLADPTAYFAEPSEVVAHGGMPLAFKLKVLRQWELDARRLAESESEGMGGGEENMLARVSRALRTLEEQEAGMNASGTDTSHAAASGGSIGEAARSVASGIGEAASQVQHAATQTREGVAEVRHFIRAQPITSALLIFGFGYLSGRVASAFHGGRD